ncbi:MAG: serine/threonine protein kinase [Nocardioidaceae bacterium]|nr:serine/threonine protein kinase [Nocardioidaceae bacterium]
MRRTAALLATLALGATALVASDVTTASAAPDPLRDVMFVGNNWAGTATIVDAHTRQVLRTGVNLIPDKAQELADIYKAPDRLAFYLLIQQGPGEGHDQYVDDMFTTNDGRYVAVSRPSFGDVVWIDIAKAAAGQTDSIVREQSMDGFRTDHMGLSPDGRRLLVSDSTKAQVIEYSMVNEVVGLKIIKMGDRLRTFPSGETPHENNYSPDGTKIYHASIGKVYLPGDEHSIGPVKIGPLHDALKGDRWYQIVNNSDFSIDKRWDMGKELAEAGYDGMSAAVRPMAVAPDQRFLYFQVSYFHGIVEFDTQAPDIDSQVTYTAGGIAEPRVGRVTRLITLPNRVPNLPLEDYVNDSAHHGLSMNSQGTTLCAAGTMDDYAALVDRATGAPTIFDTATTGHGYLKPYWTTEGLDDTCWISLSESDSVAVIDFDTKQEIAYLPVGDHPQRVRHGYVPESVVAAWGPPAGGGGIDNPGSGGLINTVSSLIGLVLSLVNPILPVR